MNTFIRRILLLAFLSVLASQLVASPLGTAFTYQGRLIVGAGVANGSYDLRFVLYTAETGGSQVGSILTNTTVPIVAGLFSTVVDLGPGVFNGAAGWLEIAVRPSGVGSFTTLDPRQPLPPVPNSIYATQAGNAALLNGQVASTYAPDSGSPAYVAKAGDTMTGPLIVPVNGLGAGANQLTLSGGNVGVGTGAPSEKLDVAGNINYSGQLTRLDVADNWEATVRAADFRLGHSLRHGLTPGRALVDFTDRLCVNFAADWASTCIYGGVVVDPDGSNGGTLNPGLSFGQSSGEGVASKRTAGGNQYGLDFYQNSQPRLSIIAGGNVGIGTTAPTEKLEVAGAITSTGTGATPSIRLKNTAATEWRITSYLDDKLLFWNGTNRMAITKDGKVGINTTAPAFTLDVDGSLRGADVIATGIFRWARDGGYLNLGLMSPYAVWSSSDARLKREVQPITNAVKAVQQLRGVSYHWNDAGLKHLTREIEEQWKSASGKPEDDRKLWAEKRAERYQELAKIQRGFIAQEVERVFPEWVSTDPQTGLKQIDTHAIDAVLVNAIKEQQDQLDAQQRRISALEERLQALEKANRVGADNGVVSR